MNRPALVRRIFAELRESADADATSAELLRVASAIADAYRSAFHGEPKDLPDYKGGTPFECWAVDRAFADGGWRVQRFEQELAALRYEQDSAPNAEELAYRDWLLENAA